MARHGGKIWLFLGSGFVWLVPTDGIKPKRRLLRKWRKRVQRIDLLDAKRWSYRHDRAGWYFEPEAKT